MRYPGAKAPINGSYSPEDHPSEMDSRNSELPSRPLLQSLSLFTALEPHKSPPPGHPSPSLISHHLSKSYSITESCTHASNTIGFASHSHNSSCHQALKPNLPNVSLPDQISELPEEILINILSLLTLREAVRTSVLSHRWKNLWTFTTGSLDFEFVDQDMGSYLSLVNKILNSHQGATIDEFRVKFDWQIRARSDIDRWLNFALRKRVQRLELNLDGVRASWDDRYPFFAAPSLGSNDNINNFSCLRSLNLTHVDVRGEFLVYLLSNCPFLEFVRIISSTGLVNVRVVDPLPKLKHFEISCCYELEVLDISSAPNLTTLIYGGPLEAWLCFRNVPNLSHVSLEGFYCSDMIWRFDQLPVALSQIKKLELVLDTEMHPKFPKLFPELKNVKELDLHLRAFGDYSLLSCTSVIEACPKLYRFSMQLDWLGLPEEQQQMIVQTKKCSMEMKCLRVVELRYFRGSRIFMELATCLLSSAPFVEKIIADTRNPYVVGSSPCLQLDEETVLSSKECAKRLAAELSPTAELVIL
ncbi:hypothetical protein LguiA_010272 [Lonicera macranthoides]